MRETEYDWRHFEGERVRALMSQDAEKYARLCYELGIEPEDPDLYNQGALPEYNLSGLEKTVNEGAEDINPLRRGKRSVSNAVYGRFYEEGRGVSRNIFLETDTKIRLLREYFPMKGDTDNMTPRQIGTKFQSMIKYAERRMRENQ